MALSRLRRFEEKRLRHRMALFLTLSIGLILFVVLFGVKILIGFSLFVDQIRGNSPQTQQQNSAILIAPQLDPTFEATNSATITVTGKAQGEVTLVLYVNDTEVKKTSVEKDGSFAIKNVAIHDGKNTINARIMDDMKNASELSNTIVVEYVKRAPLIEIVTPADNQEYYAEDNQVAITGRTEEDMTVTVNGRVIVVATDGTFTGNYPLSEGDNKLTFIATDNAGNQTTVEKTVKYRK